MYYNEITRKMTEYPYRFKTHSEFVDEFGGNYNNFNDDDDFIYCLLSQDLYTGTFV